MWNLYSFSMHDSKNPPYPIDQGICITLDDGGIFEKGTHLSKEDLKNKSLIIENPNHTSGLYRKYAEHVKENVKSK